MASRISSRQVWCAETASFHDEGEILPVDVSMPRGGDDDFDLVWTCRCGFECDITRGLFCEHEAARLGVKR